ncbi:TolC family protein [Methylophaga frappieri]|uniref:TolC family protein n=1 Tax=Methylophaga frappieri (strain ATCC BAA-2434 / DSM 25690 / JAM7) TaxID=754477 RepID=UPI001EE645F4|nr:TolC family protein [Methylophaga frappieri]
MPKQPDYAAITTQQIAAVSPWQNHTAASEVGNLNTLIDAPEVYKLIDLALHNNPSLRQTLLTLEALEKQQNIARAQRLPLVTSGFSANRNKETNNQFTTNVNISWQADVWGQLADLEQAAELDVLQQTLLLQSARDTLAAEVMRNWITLITQQRAIDIEAQRLDSLQRTQTFILQRYQQGLGLLEDLDSARTAVASSEAQLESLHEAFRQQQLFMRTLLGQIDLPTFDNLPKNYPKVALPLAALPTQSLARRPDLQAAYIAIKSSQQRTVAAYKDILPELSFQAILQDVASSPRAALFESPVWSLLGQLTATLYDGGERRANAEIGELQTEIAYESYRDQLLIAVTEIEQALSNEQALVRQQAFVEKALASAENNLRQYQQGYQSGLRTILDLLTVQQQNFNLQSQRDDLIYQRLINRVNLGLALGLEIQA